MMTMIRSDNKQFPFSPRNSGIPEMNALSKGSITVQKVAKLNSQLDGGGGRALVEKLDSVLKWANEQFPDGGLIQKTSFGPSGLVILHRLHCLGLLHQGGIPVITIDTLHLFDETYSFMNTLRTNTFFAGMDLRVYGPEGLKNRADFEDKYGQDLWKKDPHMYAQVSKVEPTLRSVKETNASAWITGRRCSQGGERNDMQMFEVVKTVIPSNDGQGSVISCLRINPLAHWSEKDVWAYIRCYEIPYNPLHDIGYKSIGDEMTTLPVAAGAEERSGRFVGQETTECGMHSPLSNLKNARK